MCLLTSHFMINLWLHAFLLFFVVSTPNTCCLCFGPQIKWPQTNDWLRSKSKISNFVWGRGSMPDMPWRVQLCQFFSIPSPQPLYHLLHSHNCSYWNHNWTRGRKHMYASKQMVANFWKCSKKPMVQWRKDLACSQNKWTTTVNLTNFCATIQILVFSVSCYLGLYMGYCIQQWYILTSRCCTPHPLWTLTKPTLERTLDTRLHIRSCSSYSNWRTPKRNSTYKAFRIPLKDISTYMNKQENFVYTTVEAADALSQVFQS